MRSLLVMLSAVMSIVAGGAAAQTISSGTAFSVAPELLITNRHVVKGCSSVDVVSPDGRRTGSILAAGDELAAFIVALRVKTAHRIVSQRFVGALQGGVAACPSPSQKPDARRTFSLVFTRAQQSNRGADAIFTAARR